MPRAIDADEIRKRCIYPLIDEAAAILAEGIAAGAEDVDLVWVHGYGFPAARGGPLHYADSIGLRAIYDEMRAFERRLGSSCAPSHPFAELATSGRSFMRIR